MTRLILDREIRVRNGLVRMKIWQLDKPISGVFHSYKYRLVYLEGRRLRILYDVHTGKLDHKHIEGQEMPYEFQSIRRLIVDFLADVERLAK